MKKGKVLVIKTSDLFPEGIWEGFREDPYEEYLSTIVGKSFFKERSEVEEDEGLQQIITQIILKVNKKILIHKIPPTSNEGRLHDMWPIFIGGHVDEIDGNINAALAREFEEEIDYKGDMLSKKYLGVVKLDDTPVNKVHVGLVYLFEGDSEEFKLNGDRGIANARFVDLPQLEDYSGNLSYWSKAFYPYLRKFI